MLIEETPITASRGAAARRKQAGRFGLRSGSRCLYNSRRRPGRLWHRSGIEARRQGAGDVAKGSEVFPGGEI